MVGISESGKNEIEDLIDAIKNKNVENLKTILKNSNKKILKFY